jgi:hypothetical protein
VNKGCALVYGFVSLFLIQTCDFILQSSDLAHEETGTSWVMMRSLRVTEMGVGGGRARGVDF